MSTADVLYADYNGHERPLSRMYFSLDSKCLVADHPESLQEEVESHFCPHCNSLWHGPEAQSNGNRCSQCYECPDCACVLTPSPTSLESLALAFSPSPSPSSRSISPPSGGNSNASLELCMRCLYCRWSSEDELSVVAPDLAALAEAMSKGEKKVRGNKAIIDGLLASAKQREMDALREVAGGARGGGGGSRNRSASSSSPGVSGPASLKDSTGPWKVGDLEEAVSLREKTIARSAQSLGISNTTFPRTIEDTDGPDPALWSVTDGHESAGLKDKVDASLRSSLYGGNTTHTNPSATEGVKEVETKPEGEAVSDWPRRVRLRTRLGKRCRKDLAAGRAGILIKATFNPLEGDSSGAKKGGKWFKKDCSAALLVPRLTVAALPSRSAIMRLSRASTEANREPSTTALEKDMAMGAQAAGSAEHNGRPSLVLRLANPQETSVRVRLAHYPGDTAAVVDVKSSDSSAREDGGDGRAYAVHEESEGGDVESSRTARGDEYARLFAASLRATGSGPRRAEEEKDGAAERSRRSVVSVTVRPRPPSPPQGQGDEWAILEGKEDELLRAPSDDLRSRHRLPQSLLELLASATKGPNVSSGAEESTSVSGDGTENMGSGGPFVLHQQGDIVWVQLPLDIASAARVAAAAAAAKGAVEGRSEVSPEEGSREKTSSLALEVVVTVRFLLVMGDVEEEEAGGADSKVAMPIAVCFPLSRCPP